MMMWRFLGNISWTLIDRDWKKMNVTILGGGCSEGVLHSGHRGPHQWHRLYMVLRPLLPRHLPPRPQQVLGPPLVLRQAYRGLVPVLSMHQPVNQIVHFNSSAVVQNKFRTLKSFYHPAYCAIGKTLPTNPKFKDLKNRSIQPIQYNEKSFLHFSSIVQPLESLPLNP